MITSDTVLGIFLISQLCAGVLGNLSLLIIHIHTCFSKPHLRKLVDALFMHLTVVNMLAITFTLVPDIASCFGVKRLLDDAGCQAVLFVFRVTRGLSICTTSVLSTFQVITITPSNSQWVWLKPKLPTWAFSSLLCSWLLNLLIYAYVTTMVIAKTNSTHVGNGYSHAYCQNRKFGNKNSGSSLSIILVHDLLLVAIMMGTSLYTVTLLYRHRKRAQHLHSTSLSSQTSPERKATHSILSLVSCFVVIYWLNNFVTLYGFYAQTKIPRLEGINAILATSYPTICPFLLMRNNKVILQFTSSFSVSRMACFQR